MRMKGMGEGKIWATKDLLAGAISPTTLKVIRGYVLESGDTIHLQIAFKVPPHKLALHSAADSI
jgi:hypothetical protein